MVRYVCAKTSPLETWLFTCHSDFLKISLKLELFSKPEPENPGGNMKVFCFFLVNFRCFFVLGKSL